MRWKAMIAVPTLATIAALGAQLPTHAASSPTHAPVPTAAMTRFEAPLAFEENRGQTDSAVRYLARGRGSTLFLAQNEAVLQLRGSQHRTSALRMRLSNSAGGSYAPSTPALPGKVNYLQGNDPARWQCNLPTFAQVRHDEVYPGIDLVFYGKEGQFEYDFQVAPGADPEKIHMEFTGAEQAKLSRSGDLLLRTTAGLVRHQRPVVYQKVNGTRRMVPGAFVLAAAKPGTPVEVSFRIGAYDPARPLVIDPVVWYSTYLGGAANDQGNAVAVAADGTTVVVGSTLSANFPRSGGVQGPATGFDAFVTKYAPTAAAGVTPVMLFSTYLGGNGEDHANAVALDEIGHILVGGSTGSTNFPLLNAVQTTFGGGAVEFPTDGFVTDLVADGTALRYSTYLGGSLNDTVNGIAAPQTAIAVVTGTTDSVNFPLKAPAGSLPVQGNQPFADAFVSRLVTTFSGASSLVASTYLGGGGIDVGADVAVGPGGDLFVTGSTTSINFPTTTGAFRTTDPDVIRNSGGTVTSNFTDAFVSRLSAFANLLKSSTYLGGQADDRGNGIAVDAAGNAMVTGGTFSANFPRLRSVDSTFAEEEAFLTRLKASGAALEYSTFLGGSGKESGLAVALDPTGTDRVWITGRTTSTNFPLTLPTQNTNHGGKDVFIAEIEFIPSIEGGQVTFLDFASYAGGDAEDEGRGIAVDGAGRPYVVGLTASVDNPATPARKENFPLTAAVQSTFGGATDAFVLKLGTVPPRGDNSGKMKVTPASLNFGTVKPGKARSLTVTIRNQGKSLLTGAVGLVEEPFSILTGGGEFQIAPGERLRVRVRFAPSAKGSTVGVLSIAGSDNSHPRASIRLSGKGGKP